MDRRKQIETLEKNHILPQEELAALIVGAKPEDDAYLFARARAVREQIGRASCRGRVFILV